MLLADKKREINTLQERYAEEHMRVMEARRRERRNWTLTRTAATPGEKTNRTTSSDGQPQSQVGKVWWKDLHYTVVVKFLTVINLQKLFEKMAIDTLPFYLIGAAKSWFYAVDDVIKRTVKDAIHQRIQPSFQNDLEQKPSKSVDDFYQSGYPDDDWPKGRPDLFKFFMILPCINSIKPILWWWWWWWSLTSSTQCIRRFPWGLNP